MNGDAHNGVVPALPPRVPRMPHGRFAPWLGRTVLRLGGWRVEGELPDIPKAVVIAAPHSSNWDGFWGIAAKLALGIRLSILGKHTLFRIPLLAPLLRWQGVIPVNRAAPQGVVEQAVAAMRVRDVIWYAMAPKAPAARWRSGSRGSGGSRMRRRCRWWWPRSTTRGAGSCSARRLPPAATWRRTSRASSAGTRRSGAATTTWCSPAECGRPGAGTDAVRQFHFPNPMNFPWQTRDSGFGMGIASQFSGAPCARAGIPPRKSLPGSARCVLPGAVRLAGNEDSAAASGASMGTES